MRRHKRRASKRSSGPTNYGEYLQSNQWKIIRKRVVARDKGECQVCGDPAECVHHRSYSPAVMQGDPHHLHWLISLCNSCHREVEFTPDGTKISTLALKEQRLNRLMLDLRSKPLARWSKDVCAARPTRRDVQPPRPVKHPPRRPNVTTHELLAKLSSVAYDLASLTTQVHELRQRVSQLEAAEQLVNSF